jgi:hypothetical protein
MIPLLAVLMITAGYMGAVSVVTTVKWFWFLFGMAMFLPVIYSLARTFRETVITRKDPEMIELYGKIAWLTIIMWSFYPVVWLFSEGFASFSVSFEVRQFMHFALLGLRGRVGREDRLVCVGICAGQGSSHVLGGVLQQGLQVYEFVSSLAGCTCWIYLECLECFGICARLRVNIRVASL